ncbi:MAG TPA: hypothetical protein VN841_19415 [Bryobacteraceae bacterium]|nr:hypothetical protein [Bryobacteraceae bacterium]
MFFFTAVKRWIGARPYLRQLRARPELGLATLFDPAYYRTSCHTTCYHIWSRGLLSPLTHFIVAGAFEGANPHPLFDSAFYLRRNPEVAASGVNPLFHYLLHGAAEGRKPHPMFQPDYYAAQLVAKLGSTPAEPGAQPPAHPLLHFLAARDAGTNPHPLFDCRAYLRAHPETDGVNPLVDFVLRGPSQVEEGSQSGQAEV